VLNSLKKVLPFIAVSTEGINIYNCVYTILNSHKKKFNMFEMVLLGMKWNLENKNKFSTLRGTKASVLSNEVSVFIWY